MKKIICLLACFYCGLANAGLIGDSVDIELINGGSSYGLQSHVVGAGEEGNYFGNQYYDFGDFTFSIRSTSTFCGMSCAGKLIELKLMDLDLGVALTSVTFDTNLSGVNVDFGSDYVVFSWIDQGLQPGVYLSASFVSRTTQSVPEPGTLAILSLALAGLGFSRKKKFI